jgi:GTPase SAR1 family protein
MANSYVHDIPMRPMRRVLVIGCAGAGKTTFARRDAEIFLSVLGAP